jgi:tol-pal system protein YbgF
MFFTFFYLGCLSSTQLTKIENDLNKIQQQNNLIKEDVQNFKKVSSKSDQNIADVVERLHKINAELIANIDDLQSKIEILQGRIEELGYKLSKYDSGEIETSYNIGGDEVKKSAEKSEEFKANQVFVSAQNDFRKGYYDLAILGFKQFLTLSDDSAKQAEAQFWIGECFYSDNNLEDAIAEFDNFIRTYPSDTRIPGAMYKKAVAYFRLKKPSISKTVLQEIVKKYPKSPEAKLAKERLKALKDK